MEFTNEAIVGVVRVGVVIEGEPVHVPPAVIAGLVREGLLRVGEFKLALLENTTEPVPVVEFVPVPPLAVGKTPVTSVVKSTSAHEEVPVPVPLSTVPSIGVEEPVPILAATATTSACSRLCWAAWLSAERVCEEVKPANEGALVGKLAML